MSPSQIGGTCRSWVQAVDCSRSTARSVQFALEGRAGRIDALEVRVAGTGEDLAFSSAGSPLSRTAES